MNNWGLYKVGDKYRIGVVKLGTNGGIVTDCSDVVWIDISEEKANEILQKTGINHYCLPIKNCGMEE